MSDTVTGLFERVARRMFGAAPQQEQRFNIGALVNTWARRRPATPAVLYGEGAEEVLTYAELADLSDRLAAALDHFGVTPGDRVAVSLPQGPHAAICHAAVLKVGGISMPLSRLYGERALVARVRDGAPSAVVCQAKYAELWHDVLNELGSKATVIVADGNDRVPGATLLSDLLSAGKGWTPVDTRRDDPALLLYTSGTTGPPKGVVHAHRVVPGHAASLSLAHNLYPRAGSVLWSPADWSWAGGLVNCLFYAWWTGTPIIAAPDRPFDVDVALTQLEAGNATAVFLPPTALKRMRAELDTPPRERLRITSIMTGSEALGADLHEWCVEFLGVPPNEVYGQTEASAIVGNCAILLPARPGSVGVPYPHSRVTVFGDDGAPAAPGAVGEIAIHRDSDSVFLGYWNDEESTREKFDATGQWLLTGDLGRFDDDGYLWFESRKDDVIVSAGYRIGPSEIESCLRDHPDVVDVAVVGLPDPDRGAVVAAFVETRDGAGSPGLRQTLTELVQKRLGPFQRPRVIEFVDALPRTVTGKVRRTELRNWPNDTEAKR